jgi:hypothetical protein
LTLPLGSAFAMALIILLRWAMIFQVNVSSFIPLFVALFIRLN